MLRDLNYLQTRFQNGDFPTQQDFYDVFDSFEHLNNTRKNYIFDKANLDFNPSAPLTGAGLPTTGLTGSPTAFVFWKDHLAGYRYDGGWSLVQFAATSGDMKKADYDSNDNGIVDKAQEINGVDTSGNGTYYGKDSLGVVGFHPVPSGSAGGDMLKAVYDSNGDGVVDTANSALTANAVTGVNASGNDTYYGKNASGAVGFHALPSGGGGSGGSGGGGGDMTKAVYDSNNNNIVDNAEKVNGVDGAGNDTYYGKNASGTIGFHPLPSGGGGNGDMLKSTYDVNNNGVVDKATEIDGVIGSGTSTYYGKNASGSIGFHALPSGGSGDMLKSTYDVGDNGYVDSAAKVEGVDGAGNATYYGKNASGTIGFFALPSGGGGSGGGGGDMLKSVYDTTGNNIVDNAEKVNGVDGAGNATYYGKNASGTIGFHPVPANGDMLKSTYDVNNNGVVDKATEIDGVTGAGNDTYYGKNASGSIGFHALPSGGSGGNGDMLKSVYDPNDNGIVENAVLAVQISSASAAASSTYYGKNASGSIGFHALPSGGGGGNGDMLKSIYDPNDDGKVSEAVTADEVDGVTGAGNSTYYGKNASGTIGFHSLPSGGSTGTGGAILAFSFSGRVYCEPDNRWVSFGSGFGMDGDNISAAAGTATTPIMSQTQTGRAVPANTKIKGLSVAGRATSTEITDAEIYVRLMKPTNGWAAGASTGATMTEVFSYSDFYTSGNGTPVTAPFTYLSAKILDFSFDTTEDLMLQVYIKPVGNITARRLWSVDIGLLIEAPAGQATAPPPATYNPAYVSSGVVEDAFVCSTELGANNDFAIMPKILAHPTTGVLYMPFRTNNNHISNVHNKTIMRKSVDGGETWTGIDGTGSNTILANPYTGGNVPDFTGASFTPTGRLILFEREFTATGTYVQNTHRWSDDGGITWSAPVITMDTNPIAYMYDSRFVLGESGELIFGMRTINDGNGTDRYIRYYESSDDGETWSLRSTALDNGDKGWNFGEVVTRDLGGGLFIAIVRFVANNDDGLNLPFFIVSRDYGRNWAGTSETLTFQDVQDSKYNSGFIPLQGATTTLGDGNANESCLPYMELVKHNNRNVLFITLYIRDAAIDQDSWRMYAVDVDAWMVKGQQSINPVNWSEFRQFDEGGINAPDGNGCLFIPKGSIESGILWTNQDNTGTSSGGPVTVYTGLIDKAAALTIVEDCFLNQGI